MVVVIGSAVAAALVALLIVIRSIHRIGPSQIGLVTKRLGPRLRDDNPIAFRGEAGFQARLLMPGARFKLWPLYGVTKFPWTQVPAGEIGVVIAQIGRPLPIGAKSARYSDEFGSFTDVFAFIEHGGEKGVQRPVLPPGSLLPIHPVAFMVITARMIFGLPVSPDLQAQATKRHLAPESFGLTPEQLRVVIIAAQADRDVIGLVTALEGEPLPSGDIASRLAGFADVAELERNEDTADAELIDLLLGSKNQLHNNYQDYQRFLEAGGRIGLQHDPLLYGAYLLNPLLVRVEIVPMLVVNQGQVAVIKEYVGLPTLDTSGDEFKFGSIVRPGHRGIWQEPLRTGKYAINPRIYAAELVPTAILTLNWADARSHAHDLDARLESIRGKSREGFVFTIDLQVQIHVPDQRAPKVISMVGTMQNLVNEVLQSAVGNHFRNTLQELEAVRFIETRQQVQETAYAAISRYLSGYEVETKGEVLTRREIANQERATYGEQQLAETARIEMEKARGTADMQAELAAAQVSVEINSNRAQAREAEAGGQAAYTRLTGQAEADRVRALGLAEASAAEALGVARAAGFAAQRDAIGEMPTALVAVANAVAEGDINVVPQVLVTGGGTSVDGLAAVLMRALSRNESDGGQSEVAPESVPEPREAPQE
jgi:uncharacterized membrane protein YqiK